LPTPRYSLDDRRADVVDRELQELIATKASERTPAIADNDDGTR
jgi:hypothetical protein